MKLTKKLLSVFLSVLMVLSSITAGLTALAADDIKTYDGLDENYQALATALQKSYVVDANNYQKAANRDFVAADNEDGDISAAAEAFYNIIDGSEKKRYGMAVKAVEDMLKSAMGSDYTTAMNKAIGNICGNGSISAYTSSLAYKFTVNQNINLILEEYSDAADVPDKAEDKATVYTYTQTGSSSNYSTKLEKATGDVSTAVFKDFAKMFSADVLSSDYDALPDGALENIEANGQKTIDAASVISSDNIKKLLGNDVSIDAAQAYLDGILLFKAKEYTKAIDAIKTELDGKKIEDFDLDALKALKEKLDAADKLYKSYVEVQKESVENSHNDYNTLVKFYEDSFNYNKAPEYAEAVKAVEKYADDTYEFTKEELPDVKKLLDSAADKYKVFLGTPTYQGILDSKAVYDKALANYTEAYEFYDWQDYNVAVKEFSESFENETVLNIPKTAYLDGAKMTLVDDVDQSVLNAERKFVYLIDFLFTKHKEDYPKIENAVEKITADLTKIMGEDAVKDKNVYDILLTYLNNGPVSSSSYSKTIVVKKAYLFEYDTVDDLTENIQYQNNQFAITYNRTTSAYTSYRETTPNVTDTTAYGAFSLFGLTFTDDFLSRNLDDCTFEQLSFIRRKAVAGLKGISAYSEKEIAHFFGNERYAQAQALNNKCDELMKLQFNAMIDSIVEKFGNREVDPSETKAFFNECAFIDNAYNQLADTVKASEEVTANMEKYDALKLYVKGIADKANADEFVDLVKDFEDKYPKKSLEMSIYDAFNADLKTVLDFYEACSEETQTMDSVVKAFEDLTALNDKMTEVFRAYRFEQFKDTAKDKLDSLYTGELENAEIIEFTTFDIANIKQILAEINSIYGDLSEEAMTDELVINYMAVVAKLNDRITLLTNPPEFKPYSVEYPAGTTPAAVRDIIARLDKLMTSELIESLAGKPLDVFIDDALGGLLTGNIINTLVKALYPMVSDALGSNASIAGILKINVLPRTLATNIIHYPSVKAALEAAGDDWEAVDWELCDWVTARGVAVTNLDTFIDALGESLSGIYKLLNVLLNGVTLNALVLTLHGNQGYEKDILPLLELLGCDEENGLVTEAVFNAAQTDVPQMLRYIIYPLLDRVKEILRENTVSEVLNLLPNLAFIINNDILNAGFTDLVSPLKEQVDLVKTLNDAGIDLTNIIGTVNKLLASTGIKLPVLNWAEFAGIGSFHTDGSSLRLSGVHNYIESNNSDMLVQLLYYVADVLAANKDAILGLLGNGIDPAIKDILVKVIGNDKKTIVGALIKLLTPYAAPDYTWPAFHYSKTDVSYSAYTSAEVQNMVDKLSSILNNVISLLLNGSLNDLLGQNLYTNEMMQIIFSAVCGLLDNETVSMIFSLITVTDADGNEIKLDVSNETIAENFKSDFPKIAKAIKNADSISKAVIETEDWGIESEEDFVNALAAITAPVAPVISALLAGEGVTVCIADVVKLYGANGYNNAVKPLLDALTCETMEVSEFNEQAKKDNKNAIINVLNPLLGVVDKIADDPVNSVINIMPQAALFIDNNGIQTAVSQFLAPLNNILGAVGDLVGADNVYEWLVDDLLSGIIGTQLNWNSLQNQVVPILNDKVLGNINIDGKELSLKLNDIDWGILAGCLDKNNTSFTANTSDTTVTVVDYVWKTVKTNEAVIQDLLKSAAGENYETISPYLDKVFALNSEDLVKILVELTKGLDASSFKADWSFLYDGFKKTTVKLPQGISKADVEKTIETISGILNKVIEMLLNGSLNDLVNGSLYTDSLITTVAKAVYSLGENSTVNTVLGVLGIDLSKDAIAETLRKDYATVSKAIEEAESLGSLDTSNWEWNVKDRESFAEALVTVLRPFVPALNVLLNSGELNIAGVVDFKGSNGYENAVKPLLDALGCETVSASQYAKDAEKNADNLLLNIVNPLLNLVDEVLTNPVEKIAEILPQAANFIDKGGVQYAVESLLYPITNLLNPIISIITDKTVFDFLIDLLGIDINWKNLQNEIIPMLNNSVLKEIDINGKKVSLALPEIKWSKLAGCGNLNGNGIKSDVADTTVTVVDYIWRAVTENEAVIQDLVKSAAGENYETISPYLDKVFALNSENLVKILVELTKGLDASSFKADWSFLYDGFKKTTVKLPSGVSKADVQKTVKTVSNILNKVIEMLLDGSLNDLVGGALYTDDLISTVAKTIYSLGENSTVNTVLGILGIDLSKDAIVSSLKKDYPSVSKAVNNSKSLSNLDTSKWKWNVTDKKSFAKALVTVLRPFAPVLNVLLNSGELNIAGVVDFKGSNGYENAVKPLLDSFGCKAVSASQYAKDAEKNADNLLLNIVNPLLNLVDEVLANPVEKIEEILPQAANFIDKGGIQYAVESLLYPVTNLLNPIISVITDQTVFDFLIDLLGIDINWKNIQNEIIPLLNNSVLKGIEIGGKKLTIKLPAINWKKLAGCGTLSKNGIKSDVSDTTVTVVNYVWKTVKTNEKAVKSILSNLLGDTYKTLSPYINKLLAVDSSRLVKTFVDIIKNLDASSFKANWSFLYKNYNSSSVSLPDGVSSKDLAEVVEILTNALNNGLDILLDSSLVSIVGNELYTDNLITTVAKAVYSLGEDKTIGEVLNILGVDLSKEAIVSSLKREYPSVSKAVNNSKSLSNLDTSKWKWNVTDKKSFAKALVAVLRPFAPVLNVLLNSGELNIAGVVDFKGSNGYENAVKPLLDALGCKTVSATQYAKDAGRNTDNLLLNIVNPLLNLVDEVLANPVERIAEILPQAANFIDKGGVQYAVESLLYPVTNLVSPLVSIITNKTVFDFVLDLVGVNINWKNIQNEIVPMLNNSVLKGIRIGGKKLTIKLPAISWKNLAGCGVLKNGKISADAGKELMVLLRYVFKALNANQNTVLNLVGNNATVKQIIHNVLNCGADGITRIVVHILLKMNTVNNALWSFRDISGSPIAYTESLGKDDFITVLEQIDPMINELLSDFAGKSLTDLVTGLVYTNNIVNTLAKLIYTNLEKLDIGVDINTILLMLDVDISTGAVAEAVRDYRSVSKEIAKCSKWSDVKFDNINWGFQDGNRDGFVNALSAVLRPLLPVLRAVLSADDLIVLDSITIKGGNGYNTAIVPIAEALGINENQLVSVAAYVNQADNDKLMTNILNPLLDRVEEILASPVSNLAEILPNVAYFVENDGIYNAASNLIKPVTNILDEIAPVYELKLDLSMLRNIDLAGIVNSLLSSVDVNGKSLGIKLSDIDLMTLAGRGSLQNYTSVRTYNGTRMNAKKVVADKPAVLLSVLRYIVQNLKTNLNAINSLLAGLDISEDILDIINTVLEALATENVDAVIELLVDILFDINSGEIILEPDKPAETDTFIPFIPGNFYWVYWTIFAVAVAAIGVGLFFILKNKKNKAEEHTDVK